MYIFYKVIKQELCPFFTLKKVYMSFWQVVETTNRDRIISESGFTFGPAYDHI